MSRYDRPLMRTALVGGVLAATAMTAACSANTDPSYTLSNAIKAAEAAGPDRSLHYFITADLQTSAGVQSVASHVEVACTDGKKLALDPHITIASVAETAVGSVVHTSSNSQDVSADYLDLGSCASAGFPGVLDTSQLLVKINGHDSGTFKAAEKAYCKYSDTGAMDAACYAINVFISSLDGGETTPLIGSFDDYSAKLLQATQNTQDITPK